MRTLILLSLESPIFSRLVSRTTSLVNQFPRKIFQVTLGCVVLCGMASAQNPSTPNTDPSQTAIIRPEASLTPSTNQEIETSNLRTTKLNDQFPNLNPRSNLSGQQKTNTQLPEMFGPAVTMITSLMVVLSLFAAFVWFIRKINSQNRPSNLINKKLVETLASHSFDSRTQFHLLRFADHLLLVAQTGGTFQTLCEITSPDEIDEILQNLQGELPNEFANAAKKFKAEESID